MNCKDTAGELGFVALAPHFYSWGCGGGRVPFGRLPHEKTFFGGPGTLWVSPEPPSLAVRQRYLVNPWLTFCHREHRGHRGDSCNRQSKIREEVDVAPGRETADPALQPESRAARL